MSQAARLAKRNRTDFYGLLSRHQLLPDDFKRSVIAAVARRLGINPRRLNDVRELRKIELGVYRQRQGFHHHALRVRKVSARYPKYSKHSCKCSGTG